jgi:hypothetical protein
MAAPDRTAFDRYPEERIPVKVKIYSYAILAKIKIMQMTISGDRRNMPGDSPVAG